MTAKQRWEAVRFAYVKPDFERSKAVCLLARSDIAVAAIQVVRAGGENNLHSHRHSDGFWFVLSGRARFYTTNDKVIADIGAHEGVLVPRNYPYWFESVGPDDLELLQFEARDRPQLRDEAFESDRVDHAASTLGNAETFDSERVAQKKRGGKANQ